MQRRPLGKTLQSKLLAESIETVHVVKLFAKDVYIRETERSLTTLGRTGPGPFAVCRLVLFHVTQIEFVNQNVINPLISFIHR